MKLIGTCWGGGLKLEIKANSSVQISRAVQVLKTQLSNLGKSIAPLVRKSLVRTVTWNDTLTIVEFFRVITDKTIMTQSGFQVTITEDLNLFIRLNQY